MTTLAFTGCAHIHTPGFIKAIQKRADDVKVKSVWDHDAERAKKRAGELDAQVVDDPKQIFEDADVKGVIICSETDRHEINPRHLSGSLSEDGTRKCDSSRDRQHSARDEAHSITSSARARSDCGTVSPSALAVFRLMTSSDFVGPSTAKSPGLAPFRILSAYPAARR